MSYRGRREGSIVVAALWMILLSILLFWLPLIGPLIAGFVGGRVAGTATRGLLAAILPAIVVAIIALIVGSIFELPLIGLLTGSLLFVAMFIEAIPVIIGALIGGAVD